MGRLVYDHLGNAVMLDDRVLAHLQVAIGAKLRRGERFFLTWHVEGVTGSQRIATWLSPRSDITFRYSGAHPPAMNLRWVDALVRDASDSGEMRIVPEPSAAAPSPSR